MPNQISAIIVDDEQSARNVLSILLKRFCSDIEVVATCANIPEAVFEIRKHKPDVVFLDIEMPEYAGYEIVNFFDEINFDIVFVTAYDKYALKAFELSAVDYLLKPIDPERLIHAVEKLRNRAELKKSHQNYLALKENIESNKLDKIILSQNSGQTLVALTDIIAVEAQEAYSSVHTRTGRFLISKNLKYFEDLFSEDKHFFRSHKSWIINILHIKTFNKGRLEIDLENKITAKLSKYKKDEFISRLHL